MFTGRRLVIATMHGKERVIAPLLEQALGVECFVPDGLDTDVFGTFSGEVERRDDPLTTARRKCAVAMDCYQCDLAVSSEGSIGMHPSLVFLYADEEIVMLKDRRNDLEIVGSAISTQTNFDGDFVTSEDELWTFATRAGFPEHGLILRDAKDSFRDLVKGINDEKELLNIFHRLLRIYGGAYVQTDMRAHLNPTRMKVIAEATERLISNIESRCPVCETPGFVVTASHAGLPCSRCGAPTKSTLSILYSCRKCGHLEERWCPEGKRTEDPAYCDLCNP